MKLKDLGNSRRLKFWASCVPVVFWKPYVYLVLDIHHVGLMKNLLSGTTIIADLRVILIVTQVLHAGTLDRLAANDTASGTQASLLTHS